MVVYKHQLVKKTKKTYLTKSVVLFVIIVKGETNSAEKLSHQLL